MSSKAAKTCWIAMVSGLLLAVAPAFAAVAGSPPSDQAISDTVEDELRLDPGVRSANVYVVTRQGVVTLAGSVDNILAKERAPRVARAVKGVRSVINQLLVKPSARPDPAIHRDVRLALLEDPATESYEIDVEVVDGSVTLSGGVDSWQERILAETVAKGVRGVRSMVNAIWVKDAESRPAEEIRRDIEQALKWDIRVGHPRIEVAVEGSQARLSGVVGSAAERVWAAYDAQVAGVHTVDVTGLNVEPWARNDDLRRSRSAVKTDAEIQQAVEAALRYDPRASGLDIQVEVSNGDVTLRGTVDNLRAKRAVAQDARNTAGVRFVSNRLKVRPQIILGSKEIEGKVRTALARDPYLESNEVGIGVVAGIAYLSGTVDTVYAKSRAEDVVSGVRGVLDVENNLAVTSTAAVADNPYVYDPHLRDSIGYGTSSRAHLVYVPQGADAQIAAAVRRELAWDPFIDVEGVVISVDDGVVTLSGTVDSWLERDVATENALEGGAITVRNRLQVHFGEAP